MAILSINNFADALKNTYSKNKETVPGQPAPFTELSPREIFEKYGEKKTVFSWSTQVKFNKFSLNNRSVRSLSIIGVVVALILAMMGEIMLLMVIGSMIFAVVVFNRSDSINGEYLVTTHGVVLEEKMYYWYQLDKFFFTDQNEGGKTLVLDTYMTFPKRLFLPLSPDMDVASLQEYLSQHIMFMKEAPSDSLDRTFKSVINKFDL